MFLVRSRDLATKSSSLRSSTIHTVLGLGLMASIGCTSTPPRSKSRPAEPLGGSDQREGISKTKALVTPTPCQPVLDLGPIFEQHRVQGVFVLMDEQSGCIRTSDEILAKTPFRPQSTFKIPNAWIGLETGLISGPEHVWVWDKDPQQNPLWEQDLDLKQALNLSCVPCFRSLARDIGADRMRKYLREMNYGNQNISGPIDLFWLTGALRITPIEQAKFVRKSLQGELAIKKAHVDLVWADLEQAPQGKTRVFAKTGLGQQDDRAIGWVVGYLQKGSKLWAFATFMQSLPGQDPQLEMPRLMPLRMDITRTIVDQLKLEEEPPGST